MEAPPSTLPPELCSACENVSRLVSSSERDEGVLQQAVAACKLLADNLVDEGRRTEIGRLIVPQCVTLLEMASKRVDISVEQLALQTQLLRVVGNLVHTHDANRQSFIDSRAAPVLAKTLQSIRQRLSMESGLERMAALVGLRAGVGAMLNLCMDYSPAHRALAEGGIFEVLIDIVDCSNPTQSVFLIGEWAGAPLELLPLLECGVLILEWDFKVLTEVFSTDDSRPFFIAKAMIPHILSLLLATQRPLRLKETQTPMLSGEPEAASRLAASEARVISHAISFLDLVIHQATDSELSELATVSSPLSSLEMDYPLPANDRGSLVGSLMSFLRYAEPPNTWELNDLGISDEEDSDNDDSGMGGSTKTWAFGKAAVGKLLSLIAASDHYTASSEHEWIVEEVKGWFSDENLSRRPDLVTVGALILGNIARTDAVCIKLARLDGLVDSIGAAIRVWAPAPERSPPKGRRGEQAQVLHALCSFLRNLSLPSLNKDVIGRQGVIKIAAECLRTEFDVVTPLQAMSIGLIKHLCTSSTVNSIQLLQNDAIGVPSPLMRLINLIQRTDQLPLRLEAIRTVTVAVRSAGAASEAEANQFRTPGVAAVVCELVRVGGAKGLSLVNEGIIALTIMAVQKDAAKLVLSALTKDHTQTDEAQPQTDSASQGRTPARGMDVLASLLQRVDPMKRASTSDMPLELAQNASTLVEVLDARLIENEEWAKVRAELLKDLNGKETTESMKSRIRDWESK